MSGNSWRGLIAASSGNRSKKVISSAPDARETRSARKGGSGGAGMIMSAASETPPNPQINTTRQRKPRTHKRVAGDLLIFIRHRLKEPGAPEAFARPNALGDRSPIEDGSLTSAGAYIKMFLNGMKSQLTSVDSTRLSEFQTFGMLSSRSVTVTGRMVVSALTTAIFESRPGLRCRFFEVPDRNWAPHLNPLH